MNESLIELANKWLQESRIEITPTGKKHKILIDRRKEKYECALELLALLEGVSINNVDKSKIHGIIGKNNSSGDIDD